MATQYRIENGKLKFEGGTVATFPASPEGQARIFTSEDGERWIMQGLRALRAYGKGFAYTTLHGEQIRVELERLDCGVLIGKHVSRRQPHSCPAHLETKADAMEWAARGFNGSLSVLGWKKALGFKGPGAREAAERVRNRWIALRNDRRAMDCPGVTFPTVDERPEWIAARDGMGTRLQSLETSCETLAAQVETLERLRRSDIETVRNLSRELGKLRDLLLSGFNP
jgi:hypothetical protein